MNIIPTVNRNNVRWKIQPVDSITTCSTLKKQNNDEFEIHEDFGMPINYVPLKTLEDQIRKDIISDTNSLHRAITPVLMLAHLFALLPVQGIKGQNTSYLVFNWISWPTIYMFIVLSSSIVIFSLTMFKVYRIGLSYFGLGEIIFFGSSLINYTFSIHLARKWPKIMAIWELKESGMRQVGYLPKTALKIKLLTSIMIIFAIVEHTAFIITGIIKALPCSTGGTDIFRAYFSMAYSQVFTIIQFSFVVAIPLEFLNIILTCAWNFLDLFIIILACAVSDKFKQHNQILIRVRGKILPCTYWRKSRETYNLLASIARDLNEFLSPLIVLSFAGNLYFICIQLLNSLKPMHSVWEKVYFLYSLAYLVGRTCTVSLFAASINDQSKKPKSVLFSVPTESYGVEVARYLTQVTTDELVLTGCNFFSITRTFILTVAGTIVTYEIVLLQLNNTANEVDERNKTINYSCP